jgi:signal transduction histidine kinase
MTIQEVRGMAFRLRPGVLDHLGLVDALEWYTSDFERRTGITCVFEHPQAPVISETAATVAYRITQEALTNVARHSGAERVDVQLRKREGALVLAVIDDGCGFDAAGLALTEGLGIAGMRERAALAGGDLNVVSRPGGGTRVELRVPLES